MKLIIFGTGDIAQLANYYFKNDSAHTVIGFTVDRAYATGVSFEGLPLVPFDEIETTFPPGEYGIFIALSYSQMNRLRQYKYDEARSKGYELVSYVSSRCTYLTTETVGDNCFILENNTIQPFVKIGNNVTIWSGNHIGHHSEILDHNFISSHVVVSGHCVIESNCFLGVNSTIGHKVTVASGTLLGAGALITQSTEPNGVYVAAKATKLPKTSNLFKL